MSDKKDEITKIEDLPEIDRSQEEEDFTNLTDMAYKMGIESSQEDESEEDDENDSFYSSSQKDDPNESQEQNEATDFYSYSENEDFDSNEYENNFNDDSLQDNESNSNSFDNSEQEFGDFDSNFQSLDDEEQTEESQLEAFQEIDNEIETPIQIPNEEDFDNDISVQDFGNSESSEDFLNDLTNIDNKIGLNDTSSEILPEEPVQEEQAKEPSLFQKEDDVLETKIEEDLLPTETNNKTPIPVENNNQWEQPKTLNEITDFGNSTSYGSFQGEATPPFSIIIKGFKYFEDIESIANILDELKIMGAEDKESIVSSMRRGQLLIPRLSEYAAIIICHKLRHFDLEITMGLTEEIHPPKSYESNDKGFTNKKTLSKNLNFHKGFTNNTDIITTSLPQLTDYKIIQHLGIVSHVLTLDANDIIKNGELEDEIISQSKNIAKMSKMRIERENSFASQSEYIKLNQFMEQTNQKDFKPNLNSFYQKAINELKIKAREGKANSVLGINFQILPFNINQNRPQYQIMATGNLAWIEKN